MATNAKRSIEHLQGLEREFSLSLDSLFKPFFKGVTREKFTSTSANRGFTNYVTGTANGQSKEEKVSTLNPMAGQTTLLLYPGTKL